MKLSKSLIFLMQGPIVTTPFILAISMLLTSKALGMPASSFSKYQDDVIYSICEFIEKILMT